MALRQRSADDHIVDFSRIETGALDRGADRMGGEGGRWRCIECAPVSTTDGVRAVETMTASRMHGS